MPESARASRAPGWMPVSVPCAGAAKTPQKAGCAGPGEPAGAKGVANLPHPWPAARAPDAAAAICISPSLKEERS
jgi:hypothetical protein